jgi:hypothetical protein
MSIITIHLLIPLPDDTAMLLLTKLAYKIDTGLKTIVTSIQKFGKVVVESKPCELTFARKKEKQAQMIDYNCTSINSASR